MARSDRRRRQDGFATFGFRRSGVKKRDATIHGAQPPPPSREEGASAEADEARAREVKPREERDGAIFMEDDRGVVDRHGQEVDDTVKPDEEGEDPKIFTHRSPEETDRAHIDETSEHPDDDEYLEEFEEEEGAMTSPAEEEEEGEEGTGAVYLPPEEELTTDELLNRLEDGEEEVWEDTGVKESEAAETGDGETQDEETMEFEMDPPDEPPEGDVGEVGVSIDWDDTGDDGETDGSAVGEDENVRVDHETDEIDALLDDDDTEDDLEELLSDDGGGEPGPPEVITVSSPDEPEPEREEPYDDGLDGHAMTGMDEGTREPSEAPDEGAFMADEFLEAARREEEENAMLREAAEAEARERAKAARYQQILEHKRKEARAARAEEAGKVVEARKKKKTSRDDRKERKKKKKKARRGEEGGELGGKGKPMSAGPDDRKDKKTASGQSRAGDVAKDKKKKLKRPEGMSDEEWVEYRKKKKGRKRAEAGRDHRPSHKGGRKKRSDGGGKRKKEGPSGRKKGKSDQS